jgi:chromosome segregation ATPase
MAGIVEKLRALVSFERQKERTSAWDSYAGVLHDLAAGQELDPTAVSHALEAVGRSVDDLESDLELYRRRLAWRSDLDRLPGLRQELTLAVKSHEELKSEWEKVVPALDAKIRAAHDTRSAIEHAITTAAMAEGFLRSQPLSSAIGEQEQRLVKRQAALLAERQDWAAKSDAELKNSEYAASCAKRQPEHKAYHRELEQAYRKRAEAFSPHIERVESELAKVESELEKVRSEKLQP